MQINKKPFDSIPSLKQNGILSCAGTLIQIMLIKIRQNNIKDSFLKLKSYSDSLKQKIIVFEFVFNTIKNRKAIEHKKNLFTRILRQQISHLITKRQKIQALKQKSRNNSLLLIISVLEKRKKDNLSTSFKDLKLKSQLLVKRKALKCLKMINAIKRMQKNIFSGSIKLIKLKSFQLIAQFKRLFIIQNLYMRKRYENLHYSLVLLRNNKVPPQKPNIQPINQQNSQQKIVKNDQNQESILKELEQSKKTLQVELNNKKATSRTNLKLKQTQLAKIQEEYESLKFSFDLVCQDNEQLQQTIKERQRLAQLAKNQQNNSKNQNFQAPRLCQEDLWRSIFDNMLLYLYKVKNGQKQTTKKVSQGQLMCFGLNSKTLLDKLTEPLMRLSYFSSLQELKQQNKVLTQLLGAYADTFKDTTVVDGQKQQKNAQIFNRQRRYLYQAIQCLSRWGCSDVDGLADLRRTLEKIKNQDHQS